MGVYEGTQFDDTVITEIRPLRDLAAESESAQTEVTEVEWSIVKWLLSILKEII